MCLRLAYLFALCTVAGRPVRSVPKIGGDEIRIMLVLNTPGLSKPGPTGRSVSLRLAPVAVKSSDWRRKDLFRVLRLHGDVGPLCGE